MLVALLFAPAAAAGMPGIKEVRVARSATATLSFEVVFDHAIVLTPATVVQVELDTDRDQSTGADGYEVALDSSSPDGVEPPYASVLRASDTGVSEIDVRSLRFTHGQSSTTFAVDSADVGAGSSFDFYVFVEDHGCLIDDAPGHVLVSLPWTYPPQPEPRQRTASSHVYVDDQDLGLNVLVSRALCHPVAAIGIVLGLIGLAGLISAAVLTWQRRRHRSVRNGTQSP